MFARDRKYQRSLQAQQKGRSAAAPADDKDNKAEKRARSELSDSETSDVDDDDECRRILESGGRERCAYFFWQGNAQSSLVPWRGPGGEAMLSLALSPWRERAWG